MEAPSLNIHILPAPHLLVLVLCCPMCLGTAHCSLETGMDTGSPSSPIILAPSCWCHSTIYRTALALLLGLGLESEGCGFYKVMHLATSPGGPPSGTKPSIYVTLGLDTWIPGLLSAIF